MTENPGQEKEAEPPFCRAVPTLWCYRGAAPMIIASLKEAAPTGRIMNSFPKTCAATNAARARHAKHFSHLCGRQN